MSFKDNLKFWAIMVPLILTVSFGIMRCQSMIDNNEPPKKHFPEFLNSDAAKLLPKTKHWMDLQTEINLAEAQQVEMERCHETLPPGRSLNPSLLGTWRGTRVLSQSEDNTSVSQIKTAIPGLTQPAAMVDLCSVTIAEYMLEANFFDRIPADKTSPPSVAPSSTALWPVNATKLGFKTDQTVLGGLLVRVYGNLEGSTLTLTVFRWGTADIRKFILTKVPSMPVHIPYYKMRFDGVPRK